MTKYVTKADRTWAPVDVKGTTMDKCVLWEGDYDTRAGLFRMPKGMTINEHTHSKWVQVMVLEGKLQIANEACKEQPISKGEYYFVEPGETHTEIAMEDTLVLVIQAEDRDGFAGLSI